MRRRMTLRVTAILLLCLLAGSAPLGALAGPPPGQPPTPPPPAPEPTPPPPPEYPCVMAVSLLKVDIRDVISMALQQNQPELPPDDRDPPQIPPDPWRLNYVSGPFKIYINSEFQGFNALFNFTRLQQGAYIGLLEASVPFQFAHRGGERCPPVPARGPTQVEQMPGRYLLWMANAPALRIKDPPEMAGWFLAFVKIPYEPDIMAKIPYEPDLVAIIFYPDARYRSPEEMLKAARALDDGGILVALPPKTH